MVVCVKQLNYNDVSSKPLAWGSAILDLRTETVKVCFLASSRAVPSGRKVRLGRGNPKANATPIPNTISGPWSHT